MAEGTSGNVFHNNDDLSSMQKTAVRNIEGGHGATHKINYIVVLTARKPEL